MSARTARAAGTGAHDDAGPLPREHAPLSLRDVSVRLGGRDILRGVDLELAAGEVTAIIGPNGAGKSTLLAVAAGAESPTQGDAFLGGRAVRDMPHAEAARTRAVMPQDSALAFAFTVREVVEMGRTPWRRLRVDDAAAVESALERTQLTQFADREVTTLSGGERQRVALARVIAQLEPIVPRSVLLLDEPTSAMDVAHTEQSLRLMREVASAGAAVATVLHDLDAAVGYADRLVLLDRGRVRACGSVAKVADPGVLSEVYGTPVEVFTHGGRLRVAPVREHRP